jgi:hypothetical protein
LESACAKAVRRTLMKLRPGVDFIKILQATFMPEDPKIEKKPVKFLVFFCVLGSLQAKVARRTLMKLIQAGIFPTKT